MSGPPTGFSNTYLCHSVTFVYLELFTPLPRPRGSATLLRGHTIQYEQPFIGNWSEFAQQRQPPHAHTHTHTNFLVCVESNAILLPPFLGLYYLTSPLQLLFKEVYWKWNVSYLPCLTCTYLVNKQSQANVSIVSRVHTTQDTPYQKNI